MSSAVLLAAVAAPAKLQPAQDYLPEPPPDRQLVYFLNGHELAPLPFEAGRTSLDPTRRANQTKVGFIELAGPRAATTVENERPRFFLFTSQQPGSHPPFLVLLSARGGARRVTAVAQKGLTGYAIPSDEIIKPNLRVLVTLGEEVFMEIQPRVSLMAGEYAIMGDDLARIATFRVPAAKP